ncbi:hypothetical protein E3T28_07400 [Cryobacterium sinapicolor]|uniref:Glycosyltransferase RgtA/B/C/D-like domain-containing protein n=1 Tax=Cryobacterium sinapicolor TaxID=1259236 RepID=A0ABY2J7J5_9MICO|nr:MULTISPECIES: hypothetical protein [Cryobacterium]TFC86120.1 hypothetical protein E3O67_10930 [Cryobacterium sp. TMT3-29-2]TFD00916.1 hypothetical protein E3T28_07400 [Cryobacterium sinapicolor]
MTVSHEQTVTAAAKYQSRWRRLFIALWVPVVLVIASFGMSAVVTANHGPALSPVDEWVYVDYLFKLPVQGIVHEGEKIGKEALVIMSCDGVTPYGPMGPACGSSVADLSVFPYKGVTSADAYTPAYFAVTRVVGDAVHTVTGINQLSSWRVTGALWLGLASVLLHLLLRQWRIRRPVILGLGLALIASPFAWWTYTYISTDAPSLAFGILLLLTAVKIGRGQWSGWWLAVISTAAVLFKVTNVLGVCLAALYLLILWLLERKETHWAGWKTRRPYQRNRSSLGLLFFAVLALGASVTAQLAWLAFRSAEAVGIPVDQAIGIPLTPEELVSQVATFLPSAIVSNVNVTGSTDLAYAIPGFVVAPLTWICVAGVLGAFWTLRKGSKLTPIVVSVTMAALFFAPMLAIMIHVTTGNYFPLPPRYGASIVGSFLLLAGLTIRNRWAVGILVAYSVALYAYVLVSAPLLA